jgi:hypothetical protein
LPKSTRRGRSSIDDEPALGVMALLLDANESLSVWDIAYKVAAGSGGSSHDSTARRLHRKFKRRGAEYRETAALGRDRLISFFGRFDLPSVEEQAVSGLAAELVSVHRAADLHGHAAAVQRLFLALAGIGEPPITCRPR